MCGQPFAENFTPVDIEELDVFQFLPFRLHSLCPESFGFVGFQLSEFFQEPGYFHGVELGQEAVIIGELFSNLRDTFLVEFVESLAVLTKDVFKEAIRS